MSLQATLTLHTIRCIAQNEGSGSEPYIWPFLATVATNPATFDTFPTAAILADSRKVVGTSMKAGATASLEFPGNQVMHSFGDDQDECTALLIVALMEADDSRVVSMQAGYQAFLDELRLQLGHKVLALKSATPQEQDAMIEDIKKAVQARSYDAVKGTLSGWEKFKIGVGALDPDDFLAVDYALFQDVTASAGPSAFTLNLTASGNRFEIDGTMTLEDLEPAPCQAQIDAIAAANQAIAALQKQVQTLQVMLATATPQQKSAIVDAIERIREDQMPAAEEDLRRAQYALRRCELLIDTHPVDVGGPLVTPVVP